MAKTLALVFGYGFLFMGILGFFSNPLVGSTGLFLTDLNHNIVHLLSGTIFLWVGYGAVSKAGMVMKIFGVVYLLVALLGFMQSGNSLLGIMSSNMADTWLNVVLGIVILLAGVRASKSPMVTQTM